MLARTTPNARILIFEYESQWFGKGSIDQRLASVANQLVQAVLYSRPVYNRIKPRFQAQAH